MNLYLQILSQVQTADLFRMILVPGALCSRFGGCQLKMSAGGKLQTRNFSTLDEAVSNIRHSKFNQIEIAHSIAKDSIFRMPGYARSMVGLFTVSPTCDFWFKAKDWPVGGEKAMRTRKMNAKAAEAALAHYGVNRKPTIYEVAIEIDTSEPQDKVLDASTEWLAEFVPKHFGSLALFGCIDVGGREFFVKLESNVLMTENIRVMSKLLPAAYPELGQKFDALHPVMFGAKRVCEGIGLALGRDARVILDDAVDDFAVVRVKADSQARATRSRVSEWILSSEA